MKEIVKRYPGNPIITRDDVRGGCNSVFNSAVVKRDGKYVGVFRVERKDGQSELRYGESADGIKFVIEEQPIELAMENEPITQREQGHVFDPRVTEIDGTYYITYANGTIYGNVIGIAETRDFKSYRKISNASVINNRNAVLLPEKKNGMFMRLERPYKNPHVDSGVGVWFSFSPDLVYWGEHKPVFFPKARWESFKIGPGAPPIKTEEGWLEFYHGVTKTCNGFIYRMGVLMLDLDEPWKVKYRPKSYFLSPTEPYERVGDSGNTIFVCAALLDEKSGEIRLYYGAADSCIGLATCQIEDAIDFCRKES